MKTRPVSVSRPRLIGWAFMKSMKAGVQPNSACSRITSPSRRQMMPSDAPHSDLAEFGQRGEHGFQVERRAADDLQHVGGRGLLLQGFAEIIGTLAQFLEQPRVLDGDHGLIGEVCDQLRSACR